MAKHIKGKRISKGSRISCKGNVKQHAPVAPMAQRINNVMREAFTNTKVSIKTFAHPAAAMIVNALKSKVGTHPVGRGWTADISLKTFKQLQKEGVFA